MTLPVGVATYFLLPDTPYTTRVWFLSQCERELAKDRVLKAGKAAPVTITLGTFKKILGSWKWYAFVLGYVVSFLPCCWILSRVVSNTSISSTGPLVGPAVTLPFGSSLRAFRLLIETSFPLGHP